MYKKALFLILALTLSGSAMAELKIGYVNAALLIQQSPQAEAVQEKLRSEFEPRSKDLKIRVQNFDKLKDEFAKNATLLSAEQLKSKERDLIARERDLKHAKEELEDDFRLRQSEAVKGLRSGLLTALTKFAETNGYDLILYEGVVFASKAVDVTDQVMPLLVEMK